MTAKAGVLLAVLCFCAVAGGILAVLVAVGPPATQGSCLRTERQEVSTVMMVGKALLPTRTTRDVCVQWEYPAGRP